MHAVRRVYNITTVFSHVYKKHTQTEAWYWPKCVLRIRRLAQVFCREMFLGLFMLHMHKMLAVEHFMLRINYGHNGGCHSVAHKPFSFQLVSYPGV